MRRVSFGTLLIGLNTGLVLLAVVAVAFAALEVLEHFANEQALARVSLAGAGAQEAVERSARDVVTSANLLSERPTVGRLLRDEDAPGLSAFLDRFRKTSRLSGVAVLSRGRIFAASGAPLPWKEMQARARDGEASLVRLTDGTLLFEAAVPLVTSSGATAIAALDLGERFTRETAEQVGLPVAILATIDAADRTEDPRLPLRAEVMATGEPSSGSLDKAGVYLSVHPRRAPSGEVA